MIAVHSTFHKLSINDMDFHFYACTRRPLKSEQTKKKPLMSLILIFRHTASVAAGNHGVPVVVAGHHFGNASGMAPRSQ